MIDISYGILHYNPSSDEGARVAFLNAVESLAINRNSRFSSEVTIIDQGNPNVEVQAGYEIANHYGFNFIALPSNVGISRGINLIARSARGKYVSLVTSDTIFTKGLDTILVDSLECDPSIWQICPRSNKSSFKEQQYETDLPFGTYDVVTGQEGTVSRLAQELTIQFWPRHVFDRIGYFDERWKACYENLDYALRIILAGGDVHISHEAFCWHIHNMTTKNGSINKAYNGYIAMDGIDHSVLNRMWAQKWNNTDKEILYGNRNNIEIFLDLSKPVYKYIPFIQNVGY